MTRLSLLLLLVACKGGGATDGTDYTFACEVSEPYDLPDPLSELSGVEHVCEDAAYYDPDVPTATSYFLGEFHLDDCGNLRGSETWILFANARWAETGGGDCRVVWDLTGARGEPQGVGDYSVSFTATVDPGRTDCAEDLWEDEVTFDQTYDVRVDEAGASTVYWVGGALDGTVLGTGAGNGNHFTWVSDVSCKLF